MNLEKLEQEYNKEIQMETILKTNGDKTFEEITKDMTRFKKWLFFIKKNIKYNPFMSMFSFLYLFSPTMFLLNHPKTLLDFFALYFSFLGVFSYFYFGFLFLNKRIKDKDKIIKIKRNKHNEMINKKSVSVNIINCLRTCFDKKDEFEKFLLNINNKNINYEIVKQFINDNKYKYKNNIALMESVNINLKRKEVAYYE